MAARRRGRRRSRRNRRGRNRRGRNRRSRNRRGRNRRGVPGLAWLGEVIAAEIRRKQVSRRGGYRRGGWDRRGDPSLSRLGEVIAAEIRRERSSWRRQVGIERTSWRGQVDIERSDGRWRVATDRGRVTDAPVTTDVEGRATLRAAHAQPTHGHATLVEVVGRGARGALDLDHDAISRALRARGATTLPKARRLWVTSIHRLADPATKPQASSARGATRASSRVCRQPLPHRAWFEAESCTTERTQSAEVQDSARRSQACECALRQSPTGPPPTSLRSLSLAARRPVGRLAKTAELLFSRW